MTITLERCMLGECGQAVKSAETVLTRDIVRTKGDGLLYIGFDCIKPRPIATFFPAPICSVFQLASRLCCEGLACSTEFMSTLASHYYTLLPTLVHCQGSARVPNLRRVGSAGAGGFQQLQSQSLRILAPQSDR